MRQFSDRPAPNRDDVRQSTVKSCNSRSTDCIYPVCMSRMGPLKSRVVKWYGRGLVQSLSQQLNLVRQRRKLYVAEVTA